MTKICFLTTSPFSKRDFERFAIAEITSAGNEVMVLDCTPFLDEKYDKKIDGKYLCVNDKRLKRCSSLIQLVKYILDFNPDWSVDFLQGYCLNKYFHRVFIRIFLKLTCKIIHYRTGSAPFYVGPKIEEKRILRLINKLKVTTIKLLSLPWDIFNADKVVVGGLIEFKKLKNKKDAILAHNLDYDNYLQINKFSPKGSKKKLIFLDEDFPLHSDYEREGLFPEINEKVYFRETSDCLKNLGKRFDLAPIVKLHPRSNIIKSKKLFDLKVSLEDTATLIHNSNLVVAHCSTAIQLAVLFYKPIILLIPNQLRRNTIWYHTILQISSLLNTPSIRSKNINQINQIPIVNKNKYEIYIEKYIKMFNTDEKFSWEIILENLNKINTIKTK